MEKSISLKNEFPQFNKLPVRLMVQDRETVLEILHWHKLISNPNQIFIIRKREIWKISVRNRRENSFGIIKVFLRNVSEVSQDLHSRGIPWFLSSVQIVFLFYLAHGIVSSSVILCNDSKIKKYALVILYKGLALLRGHS